MLCIAGMVSTDLAGEAMVANICAMTDARQHRGPDPSGLEMNCRRVPAVGDLFTIRGAYRIEPREPKPLLTSPPGADLPPVCLRRPKRSFKLPAWLWAAAATQVGGRGLAPGPGCRPLAPRVRRRDGEPVVRVRGGAAELKRRLEFVSPGALARGEPSRTQG